MIVESGAQGTGRGSGAFDGFAPETFDAVNSSVGRS